jgi:uncharacterized protein (TIGR02588 family)
MAEPKSDVPLIQWIVAGIALVVVLASFGVVAYAGLARDDDQPAIEARIDSVSAGAVGYQVHVTVTNRGGGAAMDVQVQATGTDHSAAAAALGALSPLRFDYLPGGSSATGMFVVPADPRTTGLQVEVASYRQP